MTNIYIDTEFSELSTDAELISFGAVAVNGEHFYCEVHPKPSRCSPFVVANVLPYLQGPEMTRTEFVTSVANWLSRFRDPVLLADSKWDFFVLRKYITGTGRFAPEPLDFQGDGIALRACCLDLPPLGPVARATFETAWRKKFLEDPRLHNALVDAQCLRAGMLALQQ